MSKKVVSTILFIYIATIFALPVQAAELAGSSALYILGKDKSSPEFISFKESWGLNQKYESSIRGIKVFVNPANAKVDGILFAGENFKLNDSKFVKYSSSLPLGISLNDNPDALSSKLGTAQNTDGNTWKFIHQNVGVEVAYASTNSSSIYSVKYSYVPSAYTAASKSAAGINSQPVLMASASKTPAAANASITKTTTFSPAQLKQAVMDVFKAYKESAFYGVKGKLRSEKNNFNYKYTYTSKLKIPGEQFNMLYSYPFSSSNLDFISILKESDTYDKAFEATYKEFEKRLMETFPAKDGWVASCIVNKESKSMSDLQFRNDRYGAVVLDYCKTPKGKHILYMRFLLFSN